MKNLIGLAAAGCVLNGAEAFRQGPLKWSRDQDKSWTPAKETPAHLAYMPLLAGVNVAAPAPTEAPDVDIMMLRKRDTSENTCAYVSGDIDTPLYCNPDSVCVYNSVYSKIGCCPDSSSKCPVWTTCLDSTDEKKYTDSTNGLTLWCGSSAYPSCVTHIYKDSVFTNYSLFGCARNTDRVDNVYYTPISASVTPSRTIKGTSKSAETVSATGGSKPTQSGTATATPITGGTGNGDSKDGGSGSSGKSNTGAIVGGVVGGVGGLALIGAAIFFLLRRNRKNKNMQGTPFQQPPPPNSNMQAPPPQGGPPSMYGPPPPQMQQQGYPPQGFVPVDNRNSMINKPYDPNQQYSQPGSPNPQYSYAGTPPPGQGVPHSPSGYAPSSPTNTTHYSQPPPQQGAVSPTSTAPGMGYQSGPVPGYSQAPGGAPGGAPGSDQPHSFAAELPSERSDRELRELA